MVGSPSESHAGSEPGREGRWVLNKGVQACSEQTVQTAMQWEKVWDEKNVLGQAKVQGLLYVQLPFVYVGAEQSAKGRPRRCQSGECAR